MVAYGIYKRHKIEFIDSIRKEYDEGWQAFAISSNTESQLKKYVSQADTMLASFVMDSAGEQIKDAEKRMLEQY